MEEEPQDSNIDRIAEEGIRFTNNFASCAMSVPIRASLYTGLYPARHGSYQNHKISYSDIKSVTYYLPQAGYRVGRAGKRILFLKVFSILRRFRGLRRTVLL